MAKQIIVRVTRADIRKGKASDCLRCPVAIALQRSTGDAEARVIDHNWTLRLEAWSRSIIAPAEVAAFVRHVDLEYADSLAPLRFTLPPQTDASWEFECSGCQDYFAEGDLNEEGFCEECRSHA